MQDLCAGDHVLLCITSVDIDSLHDKGFLAGVQEPISLIRKVNDEDEGGNANAASDTTLDYHEPFSSPRCQCLYPISGDDWGV